MTQKITKEDNEILLKFYDKNKDGVLQKEEIDAIVRDCKNGKITDANVLKVISKFDENNDHVIDAKEIQHLEASIVDFNDSNLRYAGYSAVLARAFRYLAFTSDFGEAFRPIVHARIVTGTYAVAIGYCFVDVGWEAYKHKQRGYVTEKNEVMSMTQLVVERSVFQALASVAVPFLVVHSSVSIGKMIFKKLGRFQKWGPTILGLSAIPFLPLCIDEPVEHALEYTFKHFGPWANKDKKD